VLADEVLDQRALDEELVPRLVLIGIAVADLAGEEVDDDDLVADVERDPFVDAGRDQVRLLEQRLPPRLQLGEEVDPRLALLVRPGLCDDGALPLAIRLQVGGLGGAEDRLG